MSGALVVVRPFGRHKIGDVIADGDIIRAVSWRVHAADVVRTQLPAGPAVTSQEG